MTKQNRKNALMALVLLGGAVLGVSLRWVVGLPPMIAVGAAVVSLGLLTWLAFYCWGLTDEVQKEAHKWAWYWGGSTGMLVGLVGVLIALRIDPHLAEAIRPNGTSKTFVELGVMAGAGSTIIGYGLAWAAWWMTKR